MIIEKFKEILQLSLNNRTELSGFVTIDEWKDLYDIAEKQSLVGVTFPAIEKLGKNRQQPDVETLMRWYGRAEQIKTQNDLVNQRAKEVTSFFLDGGFRSCVLKGQGVAQLYPNPDLRCSGDIDLWVEGDRDKIVDFVRSKGIYIHDIHIVHATADFFKDVFVEIHFQPSWIYNPFSDAKLQCFFKEQSSIQFSLINQSLGFAYPSIYFNLVHSLIHINRHIFEEGIGFRQLMDYYFILKHSTIVDRSKAFTFLCSLGLRRFCGAVMYVMQEMFMLDYSFMLCDPQNKLGKRLLSEIYAGGNFGRAFNHKHSKNKLQNGILQFKRNLSYLCLYTSETLWIPFFQLWHWCWRKKKGYL